MQVASNLGPVGQSAAHGPTKQAQAEQDDQPFGQAVHDAMNLAPVGVVEPAGGEQPFYGHSHAQQGQHEGTG